MKELEEVMCISSVYRNSERESEERGGRGVKGGRGARGGRGGIGV